MPQRLAGRKPRAFGNGTRRERNQYKSKKGILFPRSRKPIPLHARPNRSVYFAIRLTPNQRKQIERKWLQRFPGGGKAEIQRAEKLHLTIQYVGKITPEKLEKVRQTFRTMTLPTPSPISIGGKRPAGTFPQGVLFARIGGISFLNELNQRLLTLGGKKEYAYNPHLTLAKELTPEQLLEWEKRVNKVPLQLNYTPVEIVLIEKHLLRGKSHHRIIERRKL